MANTLRIKRRASGSPGAPASLNNAEVAYNEVDDTLYYGKGTGGAGGTATTIEAIGGSGAFVTKSSAQSVSGNKTFTGTVTVQTPVAATDAATKGYVDGSANQTITLSGDVTGSGTAAITATLANSGATAGSYTKVTVDAKGRVTAGTTLAASDVPTLTASKVSDFDTQVRVSSLDQMATPTAVVAFGSQRATNLADPLNDQDAATKNYVDMAVQGLDPKASVKAATTASITLSAPQTIDGVSLVAGDRVLVKDQGSPSANGIYLVAAGAWTRSLDMNSWAEVPGAFVFVEQGTANGDKGYLCSSDQGGTLGTTGITWVAFSSASDVTAGDGLTKAGNTLSVTGTANRIAVSGAGVDISTAYVGQTSITTLGAIATGSWAATAIPVANGGTGSTDAAGARSALGLGGMATQAASAVAITGGTIDNVTFDGGTF